MVNDNLVVGMEEPDAADGRLTGGKGSSLAKLFKILGKDNIPYAIMVTTEFSKILLNDKNETFAASCVVGSISDRSVLFNEVIKLCLSLK